MENQPLRKLPLFPLPLVLFPGEVLPLHIFEERYKLMIRTCLETDKQFGILLHEPSDEREREHPVVVGCIAEIMMTIPLEDGRMNLLTTGKSRFVVRKFLDDCEYLTGEVSELHDDLDFDTSLVADAIRMKKLFEELIALAIELSDSPLVKGTVPEEAAALSFAMAAALPIGNPLKQRLLEMTLTSQRLRELHTVLTSMIETYRRRKLAKKAAKGNGHGGKVRLQ